MRAKSVSNSNTALNCHSGIIMANPEVYRVVAAARMPGVSIGVRHNGTGLLSYCILNDISTLNRFFTGWASFVAGSNS